MSKHTQGDWIVDAADVFPGEIDIEPATSRLNGGFIIARFSGSDRAANARLAAAAPDLLEALQQAHHVIDCLMAKCIAMDEEFMPTTSGHWPAMQAVTAAISRATGA